MISVFWGGLHTWKLKPKTSVTFHKCPFSDQMETEAIGYLESSALQSRRRTREGRRENDIKKRKKNDSNDGAKLNLLRI